MKTLWTTQCILSNEVSLYEVDWEHILEGHPELAGKENLVKQAVQSPVYIQEAGSPRTAAYVLSPDAEMLEGARVIVGFRSEMWTTGNIVGNVETGYPINKAQYPNPRLGKIVWQKKAAK